LAAYEPEASLRAISITYGFEVHSDRPAKSISYNPEGCRF